MTTATAVSAERKRRGHAGLHARLVTAGVVITLGAIAILPVAALTLFQARRLYAAWASVLARLVLRLLGVRMVVHRGRPWPDAQTVYISNHPSTLDLFMLVALGLPNTRFFLSGYLRKFVPLGILAALMGTFFTVPQQFPEARVRIFQRADRMLRRTRASVYLSPEGGRVPGGRIGHFNKGAFHLATSLKVPIQPLYVFIPPDIDPGAGFDIRPGTVHVYLAPPIDTSTWRVDDVERNRDAVHEMFLGWHRSIREAHLCPID